MNEGRPGGRSSHIDAAIGRDNAAALAYYAAMGFRPYRDDDDVIPHRFDL